MTTGPGWRLFRYDTLPSTSDACIARAEAGEPEGYAVQARRQTRPRGSRGRSWSDTPGTLALSLLLRPEQERLWPFIAGLALHDALCMTPATAQALRLKWPNDILMQDRKLAGILIERAPLPGGGGWLVIGFGANIAAAPDLADRRAACLADLGPVPDADEMADRLLTAMTYWWLRQADSGLIRHEWLARAHPAGTPLAVGTSEGQITGSFSSIDEDGTLLLAIGDGIRRISTGEVLQLRGA